MKMSRYCGCLLIVLAACPPHATRAQALDVYQRGSVVRMRMGECLPSHHGFLATFGAAQTPMAEDACPEYTLVSDKVVFVIVGSSSDQLIPLTDEIGFRLHKNEMVVRLDDARHESKFSIKEMILRSEWEQVRKHIMEQLDAPPRPLDETTIHSRN